LPGILTSFWEGFTAASPLRKSALVLLLVVPVAALVIAYLWLNPTPYRVLYGQLSDRSGGEVIAALERMAIPYRLTEPDGAIEVPANQLHAARFRLAAQGLPKTEDDTLQTLNESPSIGLSSLQEQVRYQRTLEAELARSMRGLSGVKLARVHLAIPKTSPFLRDAPPATAAVVLQLNPQSRLADEQVVAIQSMVAASVPRMRASDVRVLDQQGMLLGASGNEGLHEPRAVLERDLARRVIEVLGPWLGQDRVSVQVTAVLEESETRETVERYRDRVVDGLARPLEKSVQTTRLPEGRIKRLNATIILGFDASREQLAKTETLARQALGLDRRRGDSLSVFALPAAAPSLSAAPDEAEPAAAQSLPEVALAPAIPQQSQTVSLPAVGVWALPALLLLGIVAWIRQSRRSRQPVETIPEETFDSLLEAARRQTLDNPRVTADVVKLWMRA
jgi:flagellar biosynthesis/type III secretory pathway M-ring protein FliF/YscJ